ncbi:unnamed protein product [Urochloa humidicola]
MASAPVRRLPVSAGGPGLRVGVPPHPGRHRFVSLPAPGSAKRAMAATRPGVRALQRQPQCGRRARAAFVPRCSAPARRRG